MNDHMSHDSHSPGFAHVSNVNLLVGVFVALVFLTVITLLLAGNLGPFGFVVAMTIATIKSCLVMAFFMHMAWDKPFNVFVFLTSVLFLFLFIGLTFTDTAHYQDAIDEFPREAESSGP
jgi:cytochrome c oxidase subunit 4